MEVELRKKRFISLLEQLLAKTDGIKTKLAKKLEINPSTLTRWFQGKIDPATLDLINFIRLSETANLSSDELATYLGILPDVDTKVLNKFKKIIEDLLSGQSLEQLGNKIGVSYGAISNWVTSSKGINPERISVSTIAALASEKGWTVERLLIYLGLKAPKTESNLLFKLQSEVTVLSLKEQVLLLNWLSDLIKEKIIEEQITDRDRDTYKEFNVCLIIEQENNTLASNYASNLAIHLNLKPENIKVTTIPKLPESIADINILIFDISTPSSESIALIENIEFDRNIVVFVDADLPSKVRSSLENKVTDVVVKPIDWQKLKNKAYFS